MRRFTDAGILVRLVVPLILLAVLGIAPRPHAVTRALWQARQALQASVSPQAAARAAQALALAAEEVPWRADLWEPAGRLALQGGDFQSATRYLERAAHFDSLSPAGRASLGDAYTAAGDHRTAIIQWNAALQAQAPSDTAFRIEVLNRLLEAHRLLADYPAAIADLQALTALQPADPALRYQLGLLLATQQPEAALAHLAQAAEIDPALAQNARFLIDGIRTGSLAGDPAQTLFEAGRALASLDAWDLAFEAFRQATLARPDFADAWAFQGEARQHLLDGFSGQPLPPELERALSLDPASLSANTFTAMYWERQARFDKALEYLHNVTRLYPDNAALQVELGEVLALDGDLQGGLQAYQKAVELAPQDPSYHRQLAGFCIRHEFRIGEVGLPAARRAVVLDTQDPDNLDVLGQALFRLNDLENATRFFERALEIQPGYAPAHLHLGLVYILQDQPGLARQEWEQAAALAPGSPTAEQAHRLVKNYFP